jgi:hypothetical protein
VRVDPIAVDSALDDIRAQAIAAERAGLDLVHVPVTAAGAAWSTPVVAATLSTCTSGIRIAVDVELGAHPIELAEEIIVADHCTGGRMMAIVAADLDRELVDESLTVLLASFAARPFRHAGARWTVAAGAATALRVTPSPAQTELPVYVLGCDASDVARSHGVPPVAGESDSSDRAGRTWQTLSAEIGAARHRWTRIALRPYVSGDPDASVETLRTEQSGWGMDTCILSIQGSLAERLDAIDEIGELVRPRVQLAQLPPGVEALWATNYAERKSP